MNTESKTTTDLYRMTEGVCMSNWDKQIDKLMFRKSKAGMLGARIRQVNSDEDGGEQKTKYHPLINIKQAKDEFYDTLNID